jgi:hypothetical protein
MLALQHLLIKDNINFGTVDISSLKNITKRAGTLLKIFLYISDVKKLTQNHIDLSENDILCPVVGLHADQYINIRDYAG